MVELVARATDMAGNMTDSTEVVVNSTPDAPPEVAIVTPADGAGVIEGQSIVVQVEASDDVRVSHVELLVRGAVVDTQTEAPFLSQFVVPGGVAALQLQARATDSAGAQTLSTIVNFSITPPLSPWLNPDLSQDVNGDNDVTLADLLTVVQDLRNNGLSRALPDPPPAENGPPPFLDVDGDRFATLGGLLTVVNELRRRLDELPESESEAEVVLPAAPGLLRPTPLSWAGRDMAVDEERWRDVRLLPLEQYFQVLAEDLAR